MPELPSGEDLLVLAAKHRTIQALSEHLGVASSTLHGHLKRTGLRDAVRATQEALLRSTPTVGAPLECPIVFRDYAHEQNHRIYPLGDLHLGAAQHHAQRWKEYLDYILSRPNASILGTGDFLNTAIIDSVSDVYDETEKPGDTKRRLRRELEPLAKAGRIDAILPGNHEDRIAKRIGDCPIKDVAEALEIPYLPAYGQIVYGVGSQEYEVYLRHGTGTGQSLASLKKSAMIAHADVYVTGHSHQQGLVPDTYFKRVGDHMERRNRYFVSSGSFLAYEKYAGQRGFVPGRIGAPRIYLDGERWDIHCSL